MTQHNKRATGTMPDIFQKRAAEYGERQCVLYKKDGVYTPISWNSINKMVRGLGCYFLSRGVKKGDKIAVFSENRYEWWVADLAALSVGAVTVPVYSTNSAEETWYILNNSGCSVCALSTDSHLERILKNKRRLSSLKEIIIFEKPGAKQRSVTWIEDACGKRGLDKYEKELDKRIKSVKPSDTATVMYTSGTTGDPRGVVLTHDNIFSQVDNIFKKSEIYGKVIHTDIFLSFLPLSHVLERTAGYYGPIYIGATVAFAESIATLLENFKEVRPTIVISVPRIYEKVHAGIMEKVHEASFVKKAIFSLAFTVARKNLPYVCSDRTPAGVLGSLVSLMDKLVYSKLKEALGFDRLQFAISGGAPLSLSDAEFFIGMGLKILEGYGLTETSPVTHFNRPGKIKQGTVGYPLLDTDIRISDEGEIQVKGRQVMKGYYRDNKGTKAAFTADGYFKTGDMGFVDEAGRLIITGRIKDIIVTAGGKNISPQNIENSLKSSVYIEQAAIIGDRRKFISALIVPSFPELKKWAKRNSIDYSGNSELLNSEAVHKLFEEEITRLTERFSRAEKIKKFRLLEAEWSQESGELTPKQSVKRRIIEAKYRDEIESMYK